MNVDPTITLGAIANFIALLTLGLTVFALFRKNRRENEADTRRAGDDIKVAMHGRLDETREMLSKLELNQGQRISKLEGMAADFVPRREIENKFDHERSNRQMLGESFSIQITKCISDIRELMIGMGALQQRQNTHDAAMTEIKALLRDGFREQAAKIERLTESLGAKQ